MVPLKRPNGSFRNYFAKNQWFLADLLYNAPNGSLRTSFEKTQSFFFYKINYFNYFLIFLLKNNLNQYLFAKKYKST